MVSACAAVPASQLDVGAKDWVEFGAAVYAYPESERRALFSSTLREHNANPTDDSALRLAILSVSSETANQDYDTVIALLDFAESASGDDDDVAFARFLRPAIERLRDLQSELEAESRQRRSLQEQLDDLKQLEELLNAAEEPR